MCIFITPDLLTFASKVTYRISVSQVHLNSHAITYNKVEIPVIKRSFFEFGLYFFSPLKPIFVFLIPSIYPSQRNSNSNRLYAL